MTKEGKSVSKRLYKLMIGALKIIPMLLALCVIVNTILDFLCIDSFLMSLIGGVSIVPLLFLYITSYVFQFCIYHRMFLHYVLVNNILTYIDYYIGIPMSNGALFMLHMLLIGLLLFFVLYFYKKESCYKQLKSCC